MSAARRKPSGTRRAPGTSPADRARADAAPTAGDGGSSPVRRLTDADARITRSRPFAENLAIVAGAFVVSTLIAELAGAANLGTALSFGQIGFAIALVWVLVRR